MRSLRFAGLLALLFIAFGAGLTACKTKDGADGPMTDPAVVYERANRALRQSDYPLAIRIYEALMARYPFAAESRQARLDVIYAYYRAGESESAIDAADTFIRENPTHPRIDYAWYLKGLTDFERMPNFLERWFRVDLNQRPPTEARRSFSSFLTVVEQFPTSDYAHDSRRRMVYLRNRLADYGLAVAKYYIDRGAYVAAAQRAKTAVEEFDGSPAVQEALEIMILCYDRMELKELAQQTRTMYRANFEGEAGERRIAPKRKWYKLWLGS
jgi:outer membrane protein assembly factor BamD